MDEYIKRAVAVTVCDKQYRECLRKSDFCGDTVAWNICADIKAIPAADVAPVTRCKDCKYAYINSFAVSSGEALCTLSGKPMQQDDFCSYGEPKEEPHADDHD